MLQFFFLCALGLSCVKLADRAAWCKRVPQLPQTKITVRVKRRTLEESLQRKNARRRTLRWCFTFLLASRYLSRRARFAAADAHLCSLPQAGRDLACLRVCVVPDRKVGESAAECGQVVFSVCHIRENGTAVVCALCHTRVCRPAAATRPNEKLHREGVKEAAQAAACARPPRLPVCGPLRPLPAL